MNPIKGEVGFEVEGRAYTMVLDFNALCELEEQGIQLDTLSGGGLKVLRAVFWAGLLARHEVSLKEAGDLIAALTLPKATEVITKALERSGLFSEEKEARPLKAPAKTGRRA